ncbi:MAG TPA: Gfo/Idh/MocA family oxidoreductase [Candidatus Dormibacteraeota bacterium]|jgi:predicted dehydrogenase|nr:Gfo/Idh/MocA family oxidoreductase [Candidatus Dormibacteraeota bacterium]
MAEIGVAIQGAGWVSSEHIRAYLRNPDSRIVAIGSRTKDGAAAKAREFGLDVPVYDSMEEMLARPDVDAVSICTPPDRHCEETVLAAEAGKHALIEKPAALNPEDLRRMRDAVRRAGVRTVVSFVLRWNPAVANIKALSADGALGEIFMVQTDYWHNGPQANYAHARAPRPARPRKRGIGAMLGGGCHAFDMARYLVGSDVVSVSARSWSPDGREEGDAANTLAVVKFASGAMGKVSACTTQWMPYNFNIDVFGTDGVVRGNRLYTKRLPGLTGFAEMETVLPDNGDVAHHPFAGEIAHFVDCVISGKESHVNLDDAVNTHEACFAADLSSERDGATIELPLT